MAEINNLSKCSSCSVILNEAFILPCMHNFCTKCKLTLEKNDPTVCKLCSNPYTAVQIKRNVFVEKLNSILISVSKKAICLICEKLEAEKFCVNCNQLMCGNCSFLHLKMNSSINHQIISKEELIKCNFKTQEAVCKIHDEIIKIYCNACKAECCTTCYVVKHEGHDRIDVGGHYEIGSGYLTLKSNELQSIYQGDDRCIEYYNFNKDCFVKHISNVKKMATERGDYLKKEVDIRVRTIHNTLSQLIKTRSNLMDGYVEKTRHHMEYVAGVNTHITKVNKNGSKLDVVVTEKEIQNVDYNLYIDPTPETFHSFVFFDIPIPPIGKIKDYETIYLQPLVESICMNSVGDIYAFNRSTGKIQVYIKNSGTVAFKPMQSKVVENINKRLSINNVLINPNIGTYPANPQFEIDWIGNNWFHLILNELLFLLIGPQNITIKKIDWLGNIYIISTLPIAMKYVNEMANGFLVTSADKIFEVDCNGTIIKEYNYPTSVKLIDVRCVKLTNAFVLMNDVPSELHLFDVNIATALFSYRFPDQNIRCNDILLTSDNANSIFLLERKTSLLSIFLVQNSQIKLVEQTIVLGAIDLLCRPANRLLFILIQQKEDSFIITHNY